jgi:hypothetical protein
MGSFEETTRTNATCRDAQDQAPSGVDRPCGVGASPPVAAVDDTSRTASPVDDETVHGVSLARYAEICRVGAERRVTDLAGVAAIAAEHGVTSADWDVAVAGWNTRFARDADAARRFDALRRSRG